MRYLPALLLISAGCFQTPGVHPTLHPAAPGSGQNAGIALGALIQDQGDSTTLDVGYGEGWVRVGPGGKLELRTTPQAAFAAFDIGLTEGPTEVSLRPSFGVGAFRFTEISTQPDPDESTVAIFHPGVSLVVNSEKMYVAPRLGLSQSAIIEGDGDGDSAYSIAATFGLRLGGGLSAEITGVMSDGFDDEDEAIWTIVPSLGISIGK